MHSQSVLQRIFDKAFNQGNLAVIDELVAPDGISHHLSWGTPANRMGLKQLIAMFRTGFPDLHFTLEDEIIQADRVAAHLTLRGTHKGLFLGNSPTSKVISVKVMIYARIENDQVIENYILIDQMGILQQLGLIPPPRPMAPL
jgi:predicted ester cyclase